MGAGEIHVPERKIHILFFRKNSELFAIQCYSQQSLFYQPELYIVLLCLCPVTAVGAKQVRWTCARSMERNKIGKDKGQRERERARRRRPNTLCEKLNEELKKENKKISDRAN